MAAQAPSSWGTNQSTNANGNVAGLFALQITNSFTIVATITTSTQNVTVAGLQVGDMVLVQKTTAQTGLMINGVSYVTTANTLPVTFVNPTAAGITPTASDTYSLLVIRPLLPYLTALPLLNEYGQA